MENRYIKYMNPNKSKFAALLDKARGPRTMKKFAEDCGVNPSTFSRILNQTNKGSSSEELIRVIAEQADPESGVTLDALMEANGYFPEDNRTAFRDLQMKLENEAEEIIVSDLQSILNIEITKESTRFKINRSMSMAFDIMVEDVSLGSSKGAWLIDVMTPPMPYLSHVSGRAQDTGRENFMVARRIQDRIGRYFAAFCLMDKFTEIARISLAVYDAELYERIIELYGDYKTDDSISFILIDLDKRKIEEEFVLRNRAGVPGESIINKNKSNDDGGYDDDLDDIFWDDDSDE
jgi:transcriptional regulator with XRE-family HTH domain